VYTSPPRGRGTSPPRGRGVSHILSTKPERKGRLSSVKERRTLLRKGILIRQYPAFHAEHSYLRKGKAEGLNYTKMVTSIAGRLATRVESRKLLLLSSSLPKQKERNLL
jgi:hypothetical protein